MDMKKKVFILVFIVLLLLFSFLLFKKLQNNRSINTDQIKDKYENMFNSFTSTLMILDKYDKGQKVTQGKLSDHEKIEIIKSLVDKNDYTDSEEKAEFNEKIAKTRTIKKSVLVQKCKDYFDEECEFPETMFIFPYNYKLEKDNYVGEAVITGMEMNPGWEYKAASYSIEDDSLAITGIAYYHDFDKYCSDEACSKVVDVVDYDHILDYKDSFTQIIVNLKKNKNGSYKFVNVKIGD
jgi:hypothetical protein